LRTSPKERLIATGAITPCDFPLIKEEISIGSAAGNDLVIQERTVSRRHAKLARNGSAYLLMDLQSTNGTYVNDRRVGAPVVVNPGDQLRFGTAAYLLSGDTIEVAPQWETTTSTTAARRKSVRLATLAGFATVLFAAGFGIAEYILSRGTIEASLAATPKAVATVTTPAAVRPEFARATAVSSSLTTDAPAENSDSVRKWLGPLNHYRSLAGLSPVAADAALSAADVDHSHYLVRNFADSIKANHLGGEAHTEDSTKPSNTAAGARAAQVSNIEEGFHPSGGAWLSPDSAIEGWLSIPFHRLWMLNPNLRRAGYGQYCDAGVCVGSLNVASGMDPFPVRPESKPIEFPPDGSTISINSAGGEWPDPLTACPGYSFPIGLPVTLQLGTGFDTRLSSYSLTLNGAAPTVLEACAFYSETYVNPDPPQQQRVRDTLRDFGAIVLIPRTPLKAGSYTVSMTAAGQTYLWSFVIHR
jgi:uncharacterized protein YkwD